MFHGIQRHTPSLFLLGANMKLSDSELDQKLHFDWEKPLYGVDIVRDRRLNQDRTEALLKKHNVTLSNNKNQLVLGLFGQSAVLGMA